MDLDADDRAFLERLPQDLRLQAERALREIESKHQRPGAGYIRKYRQQISALRCLLGEKEQAPELEERVKHALARLPLQQGADVELATLKVSVHLLLGAAVLRQSEATDPAGAGQLLRLAEALDKADKAFVALAPPLKEKLFEAAAEHRQRLFEVLAANAWAAEATREAAAEIGPAKRGRPPKPEARACARLLAPLFTELTGTTPTLWTKDGRKGGAFIDLVASVFRAAGIEASSERYAREAVEEMRADFGQ